MSSSHQATIQSFIATIDHDTQCLTRPADRDRAVELAKCPIMARFRECITAIVALANDDAMRSQAYDALSLVLKYYKTPLVTVLASGSLDSVRQSAGDALRHLYSTPLPPLTEDIQCGDLILYTARDRLGVSDGSAIPREPAEEVRQRLVELSLCAIVLHIPKEGPRVDVASDIVALAAGDPAATIVEAALALADRVVGLPNASSVVLPLSRVAKGLLAHRHARLRARALAVLADAIVAGGDEVMDPQPDEDGASRRSTVALLTASSVDATVAVRDAAVAFLHKVLTKATSRYDQHRRLVPMLLVARQDAAVSVRGAAIIALREVASQWRDETVRIDGDVSSRPVNIRDIEMYGDASGEADGAYAESVGDCVRAIASGSTAFVAPAAATAPPPKEAPAAAATSPPVAAPKPAAKAPAPMSFGALLAGAAKKAPAAAPAAAATSSAAPAAKAATLPPDTRNGRLSLAERSLVASCANGFVPAAVERAVGVSSMLGPKCLVDACEYHVRLLAGAVHALEGSAVAFTRQLVGVATHALAAGEASERAAARMLAQYIGALVPSTNYVGLLLRDPKDPPPGEADVAADGAEDADGAPVVTFVGERRRGGGGGGVDGAPASAVAASTLSLFAVTNSARHRAALVAALAELLAGGWREVSERDLRSVASALESGALIAIDCPEQLAAVCRLAVTVAAVSSRRVACGAMTPAVRDEIAFGAFHCALQLASPAAFGARVVPPSHYESNRKFQDDGPRRPMVAMADLAARLTDNEKVAALAYRAAQIISTVSYGSPSEAFRLFFVKTISRVLRETSAAKAAGGGIGGEMLPLIAVVQTLLGAARSAAGDLPTACGRGVFTDAPTASADVEAVQALSAIPLAGVDAAAAVNPRAVDDVVASVSREHTDLLCELFVAAFGGMAAAPTAALSDAVLHGHVALNHWLNSLPDSLVLPATHLANVLRVCILPFTPWRPRTMDTRRAALASLFSCALRGHLARAAFAAATIADRDGAQYGSLPRAVGDRSAPLEGGDDDDDADDGVALGEGAAALPGPPPVGASAAAEAPTDAALLGGAGLPLGSICASVAGAFDSDEASMRHLTTRVAGALLQMPLPSVDDAATLVAQLLARLDDSDDTVRATAATVIGDLYGKAARCASCSAAGTLVRAAGCVQPPQGEAVLAAPPATLQSAEIASAAPSDIRADECCMDCKVSSAFVVVLSSSSAMKPTLARLFLHLDAHSLQAVKLVLPEDIARGVEIASKGGHRYMDVLSKL